MRDTFLIARLKAKKARLENQLMAISRQIDEESKLVPSEYNATTPLKVIKELSKQAINTLHRLGCVVLGDLSTRVEEEVYRYRGVGKESQEFILAMVDKGIITLMPKGSTSPKPVLQQYSKERTSPFIFIEHSGYTLDKLHSLASDARNHAALNNNWDYRTQEFINIEKAANDYINKLNQ